MQKDNFYCVKYYLLKVWLQVWLNEDKKLFIFMLDFLIVEYFGILEVKKGVEIKKIIMDGFLMNIEVDFLKKLIFKYEEDVLLQVVIFLELKMNFLVEKNKIVDFNWEFFGCEWLNVFFIMIGDKNVIIVKEFFIEVVVVIYCFMFKNICKYLFDL